MVGDRRVLVISLVGTSLLQNFVRFEKYRSIVEKYRSKGIDYWYRLSLDDERNRVPDGYICQIVRGHELYNALLEYALENLREASAELNGLLGIADLYSYRYSDIDVLLYNTKSCTSRLCTSIIRDVLEKLGFHSIQSIEIKGIRSIDEFEYGLIEILDKVVKIIANKKRENYRVFINATPGFKAETTFFVLASILVNADSIIYIHESFRTPVILPIPPITIDRDKIDRILKIFKDSNEIDLGILYSIGLNEKDIVELRDRGIIEIANGKAILRKWIRKLLELL